MLSQSAKPRVQGRWVRPVLSEENARPSSCHSLPPLRQGANPPKHWLSGRLGMVARVLPSLERGLISPLAIQPSDL